MSNNKAKDIYNLLQEIAWHFGAHGINGECCRDLSLVEFMALKKAYENEEFSIQDIGNSLNFTKSGATRIIDRLENKGYVQRQRSLLDGRICCITLTTKGIKVLTKIMEQYTAYLEKILRDLEPQMVDQIKEVLEVLLVSVQRHGII